MTRAMDYFDVKDEIIANKKTIIDNSIRFLVLSFTMIGYFNKRAKREVSLLNSIGSNVSFAEVASDRGHDVFY